MRNTSNISRKIHTKRVAVEAVFNGMKKCYTGLKIAVLVTPTTSLNSLLKEHQKGKGGVEIVGFMVIRHKIVKVPRRRKEKNKNNQRSMLLLVAVV